MHAHTHACTHACAHTHTHTHTDICTERVLRNQVHRLAHTWFKKSKLANGFLFAKFNNYFPLHYFIPYMVDYTKGIHKFLNRTQS